MFGATARSRWAWSRSGSSRRRAGLGRAWRRRSAGSRWRRCFSPIATRRRRARPLTARSPGFSVGSRRSRRAASKRRSGSALRPYHPGSSISAAAPIKPCPLPWPGGSAAGGKRGAGWHRALVFAALWTIALSWYPDLLPGNIAHSLYRAPRLIQLLDLGGLPLLTFVVLLASAFLAEAVAALRSAPRRAVLLLLAAAAVPALAAAYGTGRHRRHRARTGDGIAHRLRPTRRAAR